jgi:AraC family transcriptional regulator of adaptative response/methylated-DNA-[protein]-cysteine methyltransferase
MPDSGSPDDVPVVAELCDFIRANLDAPLTLSALGRRAGMSPAHLQRVFKRLVGISPRQFADACRLDRLKSGLKGGTNVDRAAGSTSGRRVSSE